MSIILALLFSLGRIVRLLFVCLITSILLLPNFHTIFEKRSDPLIPTGYISEELHPDPHGFMDWSDYYKYTYSPDSDFSQNPDYVQVKEEDIPELCGFFSDFQHWMDSADRLDEYDFDPECIDTQDYFRIETREGEQRTVDSVFGKYDLYTVYLYDSESNTLYVIHNND